MAQASRYSRTCIHPLNDPATNHPVYDAAGVRRRCGKPVPPRRFDRLCDEHYSCLSDEAVAAYIKRCLEETKETQSESD